MSAGCEREMAPLKARDQREGGMRMRLAFVFPGQGAQFVGMGRELYAAHPTARAVLDAAAAASGVDIPQLCFEGPAERLNETEITQPAILAVSAAALAVLVERGVRPAAAAGLSLGEYGALLAAEAAELPALAHLVRLRGRYMQEAVPLGTGGMAVVLGLDRPAAERLCAAALESMAAEAPPGGWVLSLANLNCPGQIVIAGHLAVLRRAIALGREFGARRLTLLPVSAPFHCALMRPAAERLRPALDALPLRPARLPVVANVHADVVTDPADVRQALLRQVDAPVLWEDCVRRLGALGCDTFVEVGPGRTLSGMIGRILPAARTLAIGDVQTLESCLQELGVA